ncbi:hypothetical protein [Streptomyces spirodelae]|uniref:Uncharacterized protein n=1 Tax=Streptomyces spirodelae TaxID=2812904 RepID=A0ABS3X3W8_9ACTN|nr:hypothetical protein [Streptomyces spirodelae]MBO8190064.1 hypothetical protein [Streptomyces spirodelae]
MTRTRAGQTPQQRERLAVRAVLWSLSAVLLLVSLAFALTDVYADEDPADPTASVHAECGSLLSPTTRHVDDYRDAQGGPADAEESVASHTRICDSARSDRMDSALEALTAGTAAAGVAIGLHIYLGRRRLQGRGEAPRHEEG